MITHNLQIYKHLSPSNKVVAAFRSSTRFPRASVKPPRRSFFTPAGSQLSRFPVGVSHFRAKQLLAIKEIYITLNKYQ